MAGSDLGPPTGGAFRSDSGEPTLYAERGASWWPVLWGPVFAMIGVVVELVTVGPVHLVVWLLLAGLFATAAAVWVYGRRKVCSLRLTPATLTLGHESLPVREIAAVDDVGHPMGARVLGGGWTAPKGTTEVPLRLKDPSGSSETGTGSVVIAWARAPEALAAALRPLL